MSSSSVRWYSRRCTPLAVGVDTIVVSAVFVGLWVSTLLSASAVVHCSPSRIERIALMRPSRLCWASRMPLNVLSLDGRMGVCMLLLLANGVLAVVLLAVAFRLVGVVAMCGQMVLVLRRRGVHGVTGGVTLCAHRYIRLG